MPALEGRRRSLVISPQAEVEVFRHLGLRRKPHPKASTKMPAPNGRRRSYRPSLVISPQAEVEVFRHLGLRPKPHPKASTEMPAPNGRHRCYRRSTMVRTTLEGVSLWGMTWDMTTVIME